MHASTPPFPGRERGPCPTPQNASHPRLAAADPRKQRPAFAAPRYSVRHPLDSATFFFLSAQCALYAARMGRYGEALLDGSGQIRKA